MNVERDGEEKAKQRRHEKVENEKKHNFNKNNNGSSIT